MHAVGLGLALSGSGIWLGLVRMPFPLGTVCHHKTNTSRANPCTKFDDSIFSHSEKFKGRKIVIWITWPGPRPFQGWSAVRRLTFDIAYRLQAHKIGDTITSAVPQIFQGVWNSRMSHVALATHTYKRVGHLKVSTSRGQTLHKILKSVTLAIPKIFHGV